MSRKLWLLFALLFLGVPIAAGAQSLAPIVNASSVAQPDAMSLQFDMNVRDLMANLGISQDDARAALDSSGPIYDFQTAHARNPSFGAIWASYQNGFEINVRMTGPDIADPIHDLEVALGRPIVRHSGGAPYEQLASVPTVLFNRNLGEVAYNLNLQEGFLDLFQGSEVPPRDVIDQAYIRQLEAPPPTADAEWAYAGDDFQQWITFGSYASVCTSGFMFENTSTGTTGWVTAGHCPDGNARVGGYFGYEYSAAPTVFNETCPVSGADYQYQNIYLNTVPYSRALDKRFTPFAEVNFEIAGGYYIGQPVLKVGMTANGSTGTNAGVIDAYAAFTYTPNGDCGSTAQTITGFDLSNASTGGDSGGPYLFWYNNGYFLGAIHTASNGHGTPIWNIALPANTWICNQNHVC